MSCAEKGDCNKKKSAKKRPPAGANIHGVIAWARNQPGSSDSLSAAIELAGRYLLVHGDREALAERLREHPNLVVIGATDGITVLSTDPDDKPQLPGKLTMAVNFAKAVSAHVVDGSKKTPQDVYEKRLQECSLCDRRSGTQCSECGCFVDEKASWAEQVCPLGKW